MIEFSHTISFKYISNSYEIIERLARMAPVEFRLSNVIIEHPITGLCVWSQIDMDFFLLK